MTEKKSVFAHFLFCKNRCNFVYQNEKLYNQSYDTEHLQSLQKPTRMCHVLWWRQVSNHKTRENIFNLKAGYEGGQTNFHTLENFWSRLR